MASDGKYGTITASKKQFHENEPLFILRAADPLAVEAIRSYARLCEIHGCSFEHVQACREHAERLHAWQLANPTLVKALPD